MYYSLFDFVDAVAELVGVAEVVVGMKEVESQVVELGLDWMRMSH